MPERLTRQEQIVWDGVLAAPAWWPSINATALTAVIEGQGGALTLDQVKRGLQALTRKGWLRKTSDGWERT